MPTPDEKTKRSAERRFQRELLEAAARLGVLDRVLAELLKETD